MTLNEITTRLGITPNPMQAQTFEFVSEKNENLVILSPTGTGKTLAYLMPVTQKLEETSDDLQAIVVVPGRELALQSATVLKNMGAGLRACACYGGRPTMDEHRVLRQVKPQIVFGTPGRLNDHIDKGNIETDKIRFIIIDEFDKCLEMGFQNEMVALMQKLPIGARRIFLSAADSEEDSNKLASKTEQRRGELPRELSYKGFSRIDYREKTEAVSDRIKTFSVQKMAIIALMTAVLCILAPISIPVFISPVPISLGVLAIYLTAYVLSPLDATISVIIFILLGTFGLPVFSGYSGGLSKLVGPTGGYIIGFLFTVYISSLFIHMKKGIIFDVIGMITGLALCYILGTIWFSYQQGKGFIASLLLCVVPFLIGDAIKIIVAVILGTQINKRLAHLDL